MRRYGQFLPAVFPLHFPFYILLTLFALWRAGPARGEFLCACDGPTGKAAVKTTGSLSALVIFAKFQDEAPGVDQAPSWADDLFNPARPGSFTHFYNEMSRGQLQVQGQVLPRRYRSRQPASAYVAETPGAVGRFAQFNLEILEQADQDVDMGLFDNDGPDGVPNSGDDDGYVDIVFINLLTVPAGFFIGTATGLASLGLDTDYLSDDPAAEGGRIRIRSQFTGFGGTTQRGHVFTVTAGTMCHEFGHVLGLTDLFDQSSLSAGGELDPEQDSAGIGKWGLMGLGTLGWGVEDGPNAFCAWSLAELGWIGIANENLVEVTRSRRDVVVEDIDRGGKVYKIPVSADEYFLLENRQPAGSYYDRNIPAGGLLIWHVDERADNDEERHKQVDLVCADGLFRDLGFPGGVPDLVQGRDNLDFWSRDRAYAAAHKGNQGDATDPFDGIRYTRFAPDTNPAPSAHTGLRRNLPLGIAVDNIRAEGGRMIVDILVRQPLAGHISADTTWSGEILVDGDVVVEPGAALRIAGGTTVLFAPRQDTRQSGFDASRGELLVFGDLALEGGAGPIRFASAASRPRAGDWSGIYLLDGQDLRLEGVTIEHARHELVYSRLPAGITRWSGSRVIPRDLVVPAGAELVIEPDSRLGFTSADISGGGLSPGLTELIVEGQLRVEGRAGQEVHFGLSSGRTDSIWYGVRLEPGARVHTRFLQVEQCAFGFSGEVPASGALRIEDGLIHRTAGGGLRLTINGQVEVDRTRLTYATSRGIQARGSGRLLLRQVVVEGSGQEGIFLGNCSLEAIGTRILDNGTLDPTEDPRSGLQAVGGRGQKIEFRDGTIERNSLYGLDLSDWEGTLELRGTQITGNEKSGLQAAGLERVIFEEVRVERNLGTGAQIEASPVEIRTTIFQDNINTGLILRAGATGVVETSRFLNNAGLRLERIDELVVRTSSFANASVGLLSEDSQPELTRNQFENNRIAIRVSGRAVPIVLTRNIFVDNHTAVDNLSALPLGAPDNYWGTADSTVIAGMIKGTVEWTPFLSEAPDLTAVVEVIDPGPASFALGANFPNPFNAHTAIPFDIARPAEADLVIYDVLGRPVRQLLEERFFAPGSYRQVWDGRDQGGHPAASGVYLYFFRAGEFAGSGRLLLLR